MREHLAELRRGARGLGRDMEVGVEKELKNVETKISRFSVATGWIVVCPITTKVKGSPFEVQIPPGLKSVGCVVASEVRTMDYLARNARFMEKAPLALWQPVQAIACAVLGCR